MRMNDQKESRPAGTGSGGFFNLKIIYQATAI